MSEKQQQQDDAYVVIPQSEYSRLYNGQYVLLTDLRKSADPDGRSSTYLEMTLKTHYPKVYLDMIKNDYILTAQEQKNSHITDKDTPEECQQKSIQHSKQLNEVVSWKQKLNKLSNPYRPVAQRYVEQLTKSLPLAQRQVFWSYLRPYLDRIPFYLETKGNNNNKSTMTTTKAGTTTATTKSLKRPRNELVSLLSPSKTRSKKQRLPVVTKKSQFTKSGIVITSRRTAANQQQQQPTDDYEPPRKKKLKWNGEDS